MSVEAARPDHLRRQNRGTILQAIRAAGVLSRTDVSARTGISPATVSAIATDLIAEGVLRRAKQKNRQVNRRGRPQVLLEPDPRVALVASVSLSVGGLFTEIADYAGSTIARSVRQLRPSPDSSCSLIKQIRSAIRDALVDERDRERLRHISVGVQGVIDSTQSCMLWSPITSACDIPIGAALCDAFGVPVVVENDCNMIAEALRWLPDFPHHDDFAAVLLGHGIGMGLYINGRQFSGARSSAVEFGHMSYMPHGQRCRCGAAGCIEAYAGDYAILAAADVSGSALSAPDGLGDLGDTAIADLARRARAGDTAAVAAFELAGEAIGFGIASVFSIVDKVPIAFVGRSTAAFDIMEPSIRKAIASTSAGRTMADLIMHSFADDQSLVLAGCRTTSLAYLDTVTFSHTDTTLAPLESA